MAGSARPDSQASGSFDGSMFPSVFPNGQRGSNQGSSLERSGSFRENSETRGPLSGPTTSRNNAASPAEIPLMSQILTTDIFMLGEHKYSRSERELRRILSVSADSHTLGSTLKQLPPIVTEELKRFKLSVQDSSARARDRIRMLTDSMQNVDQYRNIVTKKRRSDVNEKFGGSNSLKMTNQPQQNPTEPLNQRSEDMKNIVTNKRVRSSLTELEGRTSNLVRTVPATDKEKIAPFDKEKPNMKVCNEVSMVSEDKLRGLNPGGDGWEKKLRRKRTLGSVPNRINDTGRDNKVAAIHQRTNNESRPRASDALGFRSGPSSGVLGGNKSDAPSQQSNMASRVLLKMDVDNGTLQNERKEKIGGLDKERVHLKGNKHTVREEGQFGGSQAPSFKMKASRAPRTSSFQAINSSSNFPRIPAADGWEQPPHPNKAQAPPPIVNRKRSLAAESSSPQVTQWVGQRPHKMSRTRRVNVVSPVSSFEEAHVLSEGFATPDVVTRPTSLCIPSNSLQSKLKSDHGSPLTGLSESEESGATGSRSKEKTIDGGETEEGTLETIHKATTFVLPMAKNKISLKDEIEDGVRRQGRSGRGTVHARSGIPLMKEKSDLLAMPKPLKGGRTGTDKSERLGRPPFKKSQDRRGTARPLHVMNSASPDLTGESDDDREELLAAATAARGASYEACSTPFWKKIEPIFFPICAEDIEFVKTQIDLLDELDKSVYDVVVGADNKNMDGLPSDMPISNSTISSEHNKMNGVNHNQFSDDADFSRSMAENVVAGKWFGEIIPLSQRLLSAFITEDGNDLYDYNNEEGEAFCDIFPYSTNKSHLEDAYETVDMTHFAKDGVCNGFTMPKNNSSDILQGSSTAVYSGNGPLSQIMMASSNHQSSHDPSVSLYECPYEHLSLSERILMELHSIGLYPEIAARPELDEEDGEIGKVISELRTRLEQQVEVKRAQLKKLEMALRDAKQAEERNLEQLAMDKLVEKAYTRLLGGRSSSHKNVANKVLKQHALTFAKRTLMKCQKFEEFGRSRSLFSEPPFRDILFAPRHRSDASYYEAVTNGLFENPGGSHKLNRVPRDLYDGQNHMAGDVISNRVKKKEVLLEDVVTPSASRPAFAFGATLPGGAKWKRTDRERHQNKDSKGSNVKAGRSSLSGRSDRKNKSKPKQKMAHLSSSSDGFVRAPDVINYGAPIKREPHEPSTIGNKINPGEPGRSSAHGAPDPSKEPEDNIFTNLQFNETDPIVDLDVQGQDIDSWLGSDILNDEALQEQDLVGLQIPMDDLSELNF